MVISAAVAGLVVGAFALGRRTAEPDWETIAAKVREFSSRAEEPKLPS